MPVLAVAGNTATPAVVFTVYACLGALPHANLRWTYGRPIPVEQAGRRPRLGRTMLTQLAEPFTSIH